MVEISFGLLSHKTFVMIYCKACGGKHGTGMLFFCMCARVRSELGQQSKAASAGVLKNAHSTLFLSFGPLLTCAFSSSLDVRATATATMTHHYDSPLWLATMTHHYAIRTTYCDCNCYCFKRSNGRIQVTEHDWWQRARRTWADIKSSRILQQYVVVGEGRRWIFG